MINFIKKNFHSSFDESITIYPYKNGTKLEYQEKVLKLALKTAVQNSSNLYLDDFNFLFVSSIHVDNEFNSLALIIDQFDRGQLKYGLNNQSALVPTAPIPDAIYVPSRFVHEPSLTLDLANSICSSECSSSYYLNAIKFLSNYFLKFCTNIDSISKILSMSSTVFYNNSGQTSILNTTFDLVTLANCFDAQRIQPIQIIETSLLKTLQTNTSFYLKPKTGYCALYKNENIILMLDSEPMMNKLPLIGIWVSGISNINHPLTWAACIRYVYSTLLPNKSADFKNSFVIILFSSITKRPEFFLCNPMHSQLEFTLFNGFNKLLVNKLNGSENRCLTVELTEIKYGDQYNLFSNCVSQVFKHDILGQHQLIAQPITQKSSNEINQMLNQQQRHQLQNNFENMSINDTPPTLSNDSELQPRSLSASMLSSTHKRSSNSDLNTLTNPLPINSHMSIEPTKRLTNQINNLTSFSDNDLNTGIGQNCMIGSYHSVSDISVLSDDDSTAFYSNYTKNLNGNNPSKAAKLINSQSDTNCKKVKNKVLSQSDDFEFLRPKDPPAISSQSSGQLYTLSTTTNKLKYDQNLYTSNSNNNSLSSTNSSYSPSLSLNNTNQSELNLSTNKCSAQNKALSNNSNTMLNKSSEAYQNTKSMLFGIPRDSPMPTMVSTNSHNIDSPFVDVSMNNFPSIYETTSSVTNNLIDARNRSPLIQNLVPSPNVSHTHQLHQQQQQQIQGQHQQQPNQLQSQSHSQLSTNNHNMNHQLLNQMQLNSSTSHLNTHQSQSNHLNSSHSSSISSSSNNSSHSSSHPFTQSYNQSTNWFLKTANQSELPRQLLSNTESCSTNQPHMPNDLVINNNFKEDFHSEKHSSQNRVNQQPTDFHHFPVNTLKPNINMVENIPSNTYGLKPVQNQIDDNRMMPNVDYQRPCDNRQYQAISMTPTIATQNSNQEHSQQTMLNQHQQIQSQRVFLNNSNFGLLSSRNNSASNLNYERQPSPGHYRDDVPQSLNTLNSDSKSKLSGYNLSPNLSTNTCSLAKSQPIQQVQLNQFQIQASMQQPTHNTEQFQLGNYSYQQTQQHQIINNIPIVTDFKRDPMFDYANSQLKAQHQTTQQSLRKSEEFNSNNKITSNLSANNLLSNQLSANNQTSSNQTSNFGQSQCENQEVENDDDDDDDDEEDDENEDNQEDEEEIEAENVFGVALKELKEKKWPHSPAASNANSIYLNDTSMLPKLNYVSLMLDEYCDKNTSMNTQVLAMKYLKSNASAKKQIRSQLKQPKQTNHQHNHQLDKISENSTYESADLSTYYSGDSLNATPSNQRTLQPFQYFNHLNNQSVNISNISNMTNALNTHVFSGNDNSNLMSSTQATSNMSNSNNFKEFPNHVNNSTETIVMPAHFKFARESTNVYQNHTVSSSSSSSNLLIDKKCEIKNEMRKAEEKTQNKEENEKERNEESQCSEESDEEDNEDGEIWLFKKPFENGFRKGSNELNKPGLNQQASTNMRKKLQKQQRRGDAKNRQKNFSDEDEIDRDVTTVLDIERLKRLPKLL